MHVRLENKFGDRIFKMYNHNTFLALLRNSTKVSSNH